MDHAFPQTIHPVLVNQQEHFVPDAVHHARTQRKTFAPPVVKRSANIDNNLLTIRGKIFAWAAFLSAHTSERVDVWNFF